MQNTTVPLRMYAGESTLDCPTFAELKLNAETAAKYLSLMDTAQELDKQWM